MQPLPADFLAALAKRYDLSPEQTEALIKRLGDKDNEQTDAEALHISVNALRSRMTGVYTKFSIGSGGPGKLRKLHDFLLDEYRKTTPTGVEPTEPETDIDALVQTVRAQVHGDIQARCGTMRVLDMEQPIGLGDIYTSVNILEKLSGSRRLGLDELLKDCDLENFDRFLLGQMRHERVPGLEAVERYNQLMILGKPGAGKTTFMKRLAILCNQGEFQPQRVPVFVTLKDYAEAAGKPKLQTYIQRQWNACGVAAAEALSTVLGNGKALVLLDGLDEVYETDHDRVLEDIKSFAHQFRTCQCVITCRIAAQEYIFEQFTEVEVADFDPEQIAEFATKWFAARNDPKKAKTLIQRLNDNQPIQELATNPLLLTLLCLIFGEAADFPANRAEPYKEGLDILLKKWDGKRNTERDQVYKKLSLKRKEDLLSQLAFTTFERGDYFFKQATVESHIIQYIRNLLGANDDDEALQLDGEAVLKSIEAQHGLLVERARNIYSFSHLTFQEYFTARHMIGPTLGLELVLENLATHIAKKRYREIFLLTTEMLAQADMLLLKMKRQIDCLLLHEAEAQTYLNLILFKASTAKNTLKKCDSRAFYSSFQFNSVALFIAFDKDNYGFFHDVPFNYFKISYLTSLEDFLFSDKIGFDLSLDYCLDQIISYAISLGEISIEIELCEADQNIDNFDLFHHQVIEMEAGFEAILSGVDEGNCEGLMTEVKCLKSTIPSLENISECQQWFMSHGILVVEKLNSIAIKYRDFQYDWNFSEVQKEKLQQYYDSNKLLIDCLNSDCYVTKATRQYVEDTLLLPLSEIEKYPVPDAIAGI